MIKKRVYRGSYLRRRNNFLDKQLTVGTLLKYSGIVLVVLIAVISLILIPYNMGKASVSCAPELVTERK